MTARCQLCGSSRDATRLLRPVDRAGRMIACPSCLGTLVRMESRDRGRVRLAVALDAGYEAWQDEDRVYLMPTLAQ